MGNHIERRAALNANSTAKTVWMIMLILQGLGVLIGLLAIFGASFLVASTGSGAATGIVAVTGILILGLGLLILFGIWRLERWVLWLLWISAILSLPSLFNKGFYSALLSILVLVGYIWIQKIVNPKTPTTPAAPTTPATPMAQ